MQIAIVDDDPTLRISLKHFLHKWCSEHDLPLEMSEFEDGDSFLTACDGTKFDTVFMDIYMTKKDGITTAEEMRMKDKDIVLVFLTSSADHMPDAFSVHAFGYLLKPLLPEKLFKVMNDIYQFTRKDEPVLNITVGKVSLSVKYSEILYINSDSNYCIVHCPDPCKCRGTFASLTDDLLNSEDFCLLNRGLCVSLAHVKEMDAVTCTMDNGDILPINTKKATALRQQYQAYKFEHR